jgi:Asp/Glu/hydantoin racemase
MTSNTAGSSTITLTAPTPMQAAAIASGGGIWGDPVVELSTIGDQRQATRVNSLEVAEVNLRHTSKKGNAIVMGCIAFSTGIPIMAKDLNIPDSLVLWYVLGR